MENLEWYEAFASVPENAKKKITGGKLNGKTDINPMWRIKMLTSTFGPCGFGWRTEITDHWVDVADGESAAWVVINLYVNDPETGKWSAPIVGVGGSKLNGKGQGDGINDEAFKMAETDAISVACKKLGMGADVHWEADRTKNDKTEPATSKKEPTKPIITEGCPLWQKAIAYCVTHGEPATVLTGSYSMDEETLAKLQAAIDAQTNL